MTSILALTRMKLHWLLIASVIACLQTGCGDPNRSKIVGTWQIEQADTLMNRIHRKDSQTESPNSKNGSEDDPPKMVVKFDGSGLLTTSTRMGDVVQEKSGTWELVSFDQPNKTINLMCTIQDQKTEHSVELLDEDTIRLVPPNMAGTKMKIKFKRQN